MNRHYLQVAHRAGHRCEYCHAPEAISNFPFEVEHILPVSEGGSDDPENMCLACRSCNQRKGSDLSSIDPETAQIVPLFHPRRDRWPDHFRISGGSIEPLTPVGRVTVYLLRLNAPDRIEEREQLFAAGLIVLPTE